MVWVRAGVAGRRARSALASASALGLVCLSALPAAAGTDPTVANAEWALTALHASDSRNISHGTGIVVAVVDSGVDPNQPDLQGSLVSGASFIGGVQGSNTNDTSSAYHGTAVAAIIAAHTHVDANGDQAGMVGLATQAKIMPVKDGDDIGSPSDAALAIRYAADNGAQVISISEATYSGGSPLAPAIDYALSKGIVVVVGAGNDAQSGNALSEFADIPGVIDVANQEQNGTIDPQSHFGSDVSVSAPGDNIEAPTSTTTYGLVSGTSFATPWVSGEAAMLIQIHPTWTNGQIVAAIIDTASGNGTRLNDHVGYGFINPLAALQAAEPSSTANPLGGPSAVFGSSAGTSTSAPAVTATVGGGSTVAPTASSSSSGSTNVLAYLVVGIGILVVIGVIVYLITRGRGKNGPGPGHGGGGGGNGYYQPPGPPTGGHYAEPPVYEQPPAYQQRQQPSQQQQRY